jgi:hypothetical protein
MKYIIALLFSLIISCRDREHQTKSIEIPTPKEIHVLIKNTLIDTLTGELVIHGWIHKEDSISLLDSNRSYNGYNLLHLCRSKKHENTIHGIVYLPEQQALIDTITGKEIFLNTGLNQQERNDLKNAASDF